MAHSTPKELSISAMLMVLALLCVCSKYCFRGLPARDAEDQAARDAAGEGRVEVRVVGQGAEAQLCSPQP